LPTKCRTHAASRQFGAIGKIYKTLTPDLQNSWTSPRMRFRSESPKLQETPTQQGRAAAGSEECPEDASFGIAFA